MTESNLSACVDNCLDCYSPVTLVVTTAATSFLLI